MVEERRRWSGGEEEKNEEVRRRRRPTGFIYGLAVAHLVLVRHC
jgi:hypothetical protein